MPPDGKVSKSPQNGTVMLTRSPLDRPVAELAHLGTVHVHSAATLREAADVLAGNTIGLLVVRRGAFVVGVLSERDIVRALAEGADVDDVRVSEVMTEDLAGLDLAATLREAVTAMVANGVRHLLVRSEGRVVGIVSSRDLLQAVRDTM